jgi:hypothetical protein
VTAEARPRGSPPAPPAAILIATRFWSIRPKTCRHTTHSSPTSTASRWRPTMCTRVRPTIW